MRPTGNVYIEVKLERLCRHSISYNQITTTHFMVECRNIAFFSNWNMTSVLWFQHSYKMSYPVLPKSWTSKFSFYRLLIKQYCCKTQREPPNILRTQSMTAVIKRSFGCHNYVWLGINFEVAQMCVVLLPSGCFRWYVNVIVPFCYKKKQLCYVQSKHFAGGLIWVEFIHAKELGIFIHNRI